MTDDPKIALYRGLAAVTRVKNNIELKTKHLVNALKNLQENVLRVESLAHHPILDAYELLRVNASRVSRGKMDRPQPAAIFPWPLTNALNRLSGSAEPSVLQQNEWITSISEELEGIIPGMIDKYLNINMYSPTLMQAWLQSVTIVAWTAVEVSASDTWTSAVNANPARLATLSGKRTRIRGALNQNTTASDQKEAQADKTVGLPSLQKVDFDTNGRMGILLSDKMVFTSLRGIREAFCIAFSEDCTEIDKLISNDSLDALSILRNALVHHGGRADREYASRSKSVQRLQHQAAGSQIILDGNALADVVVPAVETCFALIGSVDNWLNDHEST